jgi:hypothetical protein
VYIVHDTGVSLLSCHWARKPSRGVAANVAVLIDKVNGTLCDLLSYELWSCHRLLWMRLWMFWVHKARKYICCWNLHFNYQWLLCIPPGLTFSNSTFCPHSIFMCFVWISEQTAIISLYSINWLVFITETVCVYCAVRTGSLYIYNSTFCPHSVFMCFMWTWEQTAIMLA